MQNFTRREFLTFGAGGLFLLAGGGVALRVLGTATRAQPQATTSPQTPSTLTPATNDSATLPLSLWLTKNDEFYTVQFDQQPEVGLLSWSLTVHGLVRQPLRFSYAEVLALPTVTAMHTLECIGNPVGGSLIGNAEWRGISLRDLLTRTGIASSARWVVIGGVDEYFTSIPIERAMHEHAMLAYAMNDEPLPREHGFPLRALLPGVYGQKQPKWITGIKVTDVEELGPWEQQGWSREAKIQVNSAIRAPRDGIVIGRGDILIAGVAHTGEAGVQAVEISTDGGATWRATVLTRGPSPYVWTIWGYLWKNPAPGGYTLMARARDNAGNAQELRGTSLLKDVFPNGANGIHSIMIHVQNT